LRDPAGEGTHVLQAPSVAEWLFFLGSLAETRTRCLAANRPKRLHESSRRIRDEN
jgi:hypothetical protein